MFFGANLPVCQGRSTPYIGGGHPTRNRESLWLYKPPYCWVDDHPLLWSEIRTVNELRCWIGTGNAGFHYGFTRLYLASSVTFCATCTFTTSAQDPQATHTICLPAIGKCWALAEVDRMVIANTPWRLLTRCQPGEHFTFGDAKLWKKAWPRLWVSKRLKRSFGGGGQLRFVENDVVLIYG